MSHCLCLLCKEPGQPPASLLLLQLTPALLWWSTTVPLCYWFMSTNKAQTELLIWYLMYEWCQKRNKIETFLSSFRILCHPVYMLLRDFSIHQSRSQPLFNLSTKWVGRPGGWQGQRKLCDGDSPEWRAHSFPERPLPIRAWDSLDLLPTTHTGSLLLRWVSTLCSLWSLVTPGTLGMSPHYKNQRDPKYHTTRKS